MQNTQLRDETKEAGSPLTIEEHVVVEAVLNWGSVAQTATIKAFHGLAQDVGAGVPVHLG